jgi:uncharacterized protein YjbJ (UPF0337 family)
MKLWAIFAVTGNFVAAEFNAQKKYGHLGDKVGEMMDNFLKRDVGHNQGFDADRMIVISNRYQGNFEKMLGKMQEVWADCGTDAPDPRSLRYDKSDWRKAFQQFRGGYKKIIESSAFAGCPDNKKNSLISKVTKWAHNLGYVYCKAFSDFERSGDKDRCSLKNPHTKRFQYQKVRYNKDTGKFDSHDGKDLAGF